MHSSKDITCYTDRLRNSRINNLFSSFTLKSSFRRAPVPQSGENARQCSRRNVTTQQRLYTVSSQQPAHMAIGLVMNRTWNIRHWVSVFDASCNISQYKGNAWESTVIDIGKRFFSCAAPATWNSLPPAVIYCDTLSVFKFRLKIHLLNTA